MAQGQNGAYAPRPRPTRRRSLSAILAEVEVLSDAELHAVWGYLTTARGPGGEEVPRLIANSGPNLGALLSIALLVKALRPVLPHPALRRYAVALWVQDHPDELVRPPWAPTVYLRGTTSL